ncbi:nucleotide exchange factor GrpE [Alkalinema pantanalense CENA528]|uniref:nucleotide exchange factor GrpE n=1 Tax=Alkalinema pantanalense TaxID=1620705 RepID=UPI003D6FB57B
MMGEENQPIGDTQATPSSATSESADTTPTDAAQATQESGAVGAEANLEAESSLPDSIPMEEDDTDYEAEFMKLRATYAAKERECEALKGQADDAQNQYLRLAADFENFRRRTQEEREKLDVQAKIATLGELLSVVDNFERARAQIKPQSDAEMNIHKSYQGVYKDMVDRLKKIGVAPMRAEGKEFDPNLHEAVLREPTAEYAEGTVIEELVRGYMIGDRVLRHAMVKVAAPPEDAEGGSGAGS